MEELAAGMVLRDGKKLAGRLDTAVQLRENEDTRSEVDPSVSNVSSVRSTRAPSQRPESRIGSTIQSRRIKSKEVELHTERLLGELEEEENDLKTDVELLTSELEDIEFDLKLERARLQDTPPEEVEAIRNLGKAVELWERKMEEKKRTIKYRVIKNKSLFKSIETRRRIILKSRDLENEKIVEEDEQRISDDEGDRDEPLHLIPDFNHNNTQDRMDVFLADGVKAAEDNLHQEVTGRAARDKEIEAEAKALELKKQQEIELDKTQKELEKARLDTESTLSDLKRKQSELEIRMQSFRETPPAMSSISMHPPSSVIIEDKNEQLITMLTQAINRSHTSGDSNSDNNKFFARYSDKGLPSFNGKAEDWPYFLACFETSTKEGGLSNATNIGRLGHSLEGEAREHIRDMLLSPDNVPEIMDSLKQRFGQPKHIIRAMIEKARIVPDVQSENLNTLIKFGAAVRNFTAIVKTLQCPEYLSNPELLHELEIKLPDILQMNWIQWVKADSSRRRKLVDFAEWLKIQSEA